MNLEQFENDYHTDDYANLTNGHDLYEGICRKIYFENSQSHRCNRRKPEVNEIARLARSSYSVTKFMKTNLYNQIKRWQTEHNYSLVK